MSFTRNALDQGTAFLGAWTLFLFATWIAWAPYVGVFVVRVSRGRTIQEFVVRRVRSGRDEQRGGPERPAVGLFAFLQAYLLALVTSLMEILLLFISESSKRSSRRRSWWRRSG